MSGSFVIAVIVAAVVFGALVLVAMMSSKEDWTRPHLEAPEVAEDALFVPLGAKKAGSCGETDEKR